MTTSGSILGNPVSASRGPGHPRAATPEYFDDLPIDRLGARRVRPLDDRPRHVTVDRHERGRGDAGRASRSTRADDLDVPDRPGLRHAAAHRSTGRRSPRGRVRFVGDIVAAVVAETAAQAVDAAEAGDRRLRPAAGGRRSRSRAGRRRAGALRGARLQRRDRVRLRRRPRPCSTTPTSSCRVAHRQPARRRGADGAERHRVAEPGDGGSRCTVPTQGPHGVRDLRSRPPLGLDAGQVRGDRARAVGGGFGAKTGMYVEYVVAAKAAQLLGRPVKWTETRSENMVAMGHGRGQVQHVEMGLKRDGTIVGLQGAASSPTPAPTRSIGAFLAVLHPHDGAGRVRDPEGRVQRVRARSTNTTPTAAYRGAGRPEATQLARAHPRHRRADELGIDPVEIRKRNFIPPGRVPAHTTVTGVELRQRRVREGARRGVSRRRLRRAARRAGGPARARRHACSSASACLSYVEITAPRPVPGVRRGRDRRRRHA